MMSSNKKETNKKQRPPDLINAEIAMKRAAIKAREIAQKTGTAIVISENEVIRKEYPESLFSNR